MNKERLLKLAEVLETESDGRCVVVPKIGRLKFDMDQWGNLCGTAACAIGTAMVTPWFTLRGFTRRFDEKDGTPHPVYGSDPGHWGAAYIGWQAVEQFFEIDNRHAKHLFMASRYRAEKASPTPKQVAKRIRKFVADNA